MSRFFGKLTRIRSIHRNLRTDEVVGDFYSLPETGKGFLMLAEPLDPEMETRLVLTSPVEAFESVESNRMFFSTANSLYCLSDIVIVNLSPTVDDRSI